jgi:tRNA-Thr(GGU) m(6)t(6)A37 methyltransferase TsaA
MEDHGAMTDDVRLRPIGLIRTPFESVEGMPVQAAGAVGQEGLIELDAALAEGLADLAGFSHAILIYHLDRVAAPGKLIVRSFIDNELHGVFATRSPARPNPIGLSTVRILAIDGATIRFDGADMLDRTPLLDIKPYVPGLDDRADARIGWYAGHLGDLASIRSDDRHRSGPG